MVAILPRGRWVNGLAPVLYQAITPTIAYSSSIRSSRTHISETWIKTQKFYSRKYVWKYSLQSVSHFSQASLC